MDWYLVKIIFQVISGEGLHAPQFDEQLRLVTAASSEEAFNKAQYLGKKSEDSFMNAKMQRVVWQFVNVCEVHRINELLDGVELYSRIEEKDNARNFIATVNQKAEKLISGPFKLESLLVSSSQILR